jgi:2-polyprenyl-3-methyl-5-hydroxy-6-metoxy-1,4-benzoquinol methylase
MEKAMDNLKLKEKYNEMHKQGKSSWFSDGEEERLTIYQMGRPWRGKRVLEIGCGEGHLAAMLHASGADVHGVDYSATAIVAASDNYPSKKGRIWDACDYRELYQEVRQFSSCKICSIPHTEVKKKRILNTYDVVVMQGVLEHLDEPWGELKWMMDHLVSGDGTLITSSPCFLNPRGIIWMTLATLFDVPMSLTDLHYLHPWEFTRFAELNDFNYHFKYCDQSWGNGKDMFRDLKDRLPKALADAGLHNSVENLPALMRFLGKYVERNLKVHPTKRIEMLGATAVYKLTKKNT